MRLKYLAAAVAVAGLVGGSFLPTTGFAQEGTFIPLLSYRTGPFANSGTPIANGMHDYFTMLNERDGGIDGTKLVVEECETGYKNERGVECYEGLKSKHPALINPFSTGITLALIPKAAVDHIPLLSMAYGLSASAIEVVPDLEAALDRALELTEPGRELVCLPTYTAMLRMQAIVTRRGLARPYWERAA